jgi:hypothetical protein
MLYIAYSMQRSWSWPVVFGYISTLLGIGAFSFILTKNKDFEVSASAKDGRCI